MRLRPYQQRIVDFVVSSPKNTIVMLPTGTGKTLVAACILKTMLKRLSTQGVFLVPTKVLVEQQASALRASTSLTVIELSGDSRPSNFERFDILVSTPKAFQIQATKERALSWASLGVVVFDEVHHVIKDHPYRSIAQSLRRAPSLSRPLVLGLSASLTYAVEEAKVKASLDKLCQDLEIQAIRSASAEEIEKQGHYASTTTAEVVLPEDTSFAGDAVVPESERKPHQMVQIFRRRLREGKSSNCARGIYACVAAMEAVIQAADQSFSPPIFEKNAKEWGLYAHKRASHCARSAALADWYEALRLLVVSWEEASDLAVAYLQMSAAFSFAAVSQWPPHVQALISALAMNRFDSSARFVRLKQVLADKLASTPDFRGILFVQQRVATHILQHLIQSDSALAKRLRTACLYATSSPATPTLSISPSESRSRLAAFASGECNLLIATDVVEEGMDVPAANCVISFDPLINTVSLKQRRGRGRQEASSFVVLSQREDRCMKKLEKAERDQQRLVDAFQPPVDRAAAQDKERVAQHARERGAKALLRREGTSAGQPDMAVLQTWCKKTKVALQETVSGDPAGWRCQLSYQSCLRSVDASAAGPSKQAARGDAAARLLSLLSQQVA